MIRKYSDLIILSILWIVSIYSGILVATGQYEIGLQNYFGYGLLILITALRFLKVRKIKTVLGVFLIFGSLNLIQFTCSTVTFFLTWKPPGHEFTFGIQPLSLFLLLFLVFANFSYVSETILDLFSEDPKAALERQKQLDEHYYQELRQFTDEKLKEILDNKSKYPYEQFKAARRLLIERKTI
jgi:hypothetical protein